MDQERYPGERRGLRLFLQGLIGAVDRYLGRDALLYHRVKVALERGDLASLRAARQMFNHQDTALKRRLSLLRHEPQNAASAPLVLAREDHASADDRSPPVPTRIFPFQSSTSSDQGD